MNIITKKAIGIKLYPCTEKDCRAYKLAPWYAQDADWERALHTVPICMYCKHFTPFDLYRKEKKNDRSTRK